MRLPALVCIAILAALLSGCGTDSSAGDARQAVRDFYAALERHDGAAACNRLSEGARSSLETSEKKPCEQAVLVLGLKPSRIVAVRVFVTSAEAELSEGESTFLDQTPQGWKISALACSPQHEQPYECELEA